MFNYPVTMVYDSAGNPVPIFSMEQYEQALAAGHTKDKPEGPLELKVHNAVGAIKEAMSVYDAALGATVPEIELMNAEAPPAPKKRGKR